MKDKDKSRGVLFWIWMPIVLVLGFVLAFFAFGAAVVGFFTLVAAFRSFWFVPPVVLLAIILFLSYSKEGAKFRKACRETWTQLWRNL